MLITMSLDTNLNSNLIKDLPCLLIRLLAIIMPTFVLSVFGCSSGNRILKPLTKAKNTKKAHKGHDNGENEVENAMNELF